MRTIERSSDRALGRVSWRSLRRHPWQSALMIAGIALGVAVIIAIDLANASADRAFLLSTQAVVGRATHEITGGPAGVDEKVYTRLRRAGIRRIAPVVSAYASALRLGGHPLRLLGLDPFAEAPFRPYLDAVGSAAIDLSGLLTRPGAVLLAAATAEQRGLAVGDSFELEVGGKIQRVELTGLLRSDDAMTERALAGLILCDIATAQELTGRSHLDRIDLILPRGSEAKDRQRIETLLADPLRLRPAGVRAGAIREMTSAFQTNLTALSLLALVVGMFLIFNTMTFAVVQRRRLYATLRCLGATRSDVFRAVCLEAAAIGLVGTMCGIGLGILLGQGAVAMVTQTINDLYFVVTVRGTQISALSISKGAFVGVIATVVAAALPAREAASVTPSTALSRSALEHKARSGVRRASIAGLLVFGLGGIILAIPSRSLTVAFAGLFLIVFAFALLAPLVTAGLMRAVTPLTHKLWGALGRTAPRDVVNSLSRTSIAVAALMVAVAVSVGLNLMIRSFRSTVDVWLSETLRGDVYISAPTYAGTATSTPIDPRVLETLRNTEGVERVDIVRSVVIDSDHGPLQVAAFDRPRVERSGLYVSVDGPPAEIAAALRRGAVLVSEPLANRLSLPMSGATLSLQTDVGTRTVPVVGIYHDYASSQGTVTMDLRVYRDWWRDDRITAASLKLTDPAAADALSGRLREQLAAIQQLVVRPNWVLRREVFEVFDRAFAITNALLLLATTVAGLGVLGALLALQLDRQRDLGILRAIGVTSRQLAGLIFLETGLMGGAAGLLAIPTGGVLALILVHIINQRAFGWTLHLQLDWLPFLQAVGLAIAAALIAGLGPAWRMSRMPPAAVLRYE